MVPKVAVVILNWNGRKFLEDFLPSVLKNSKDDAVVYIADNASTDDSVAFVKEKYPEIRLIENDSNGGFAKGYNDALSKITADYYVLLNSDVEVTVGWIKPIIETLESDPKIAACQPMILSYSEPDKFEYAGAAGGFIDKYGYPFCRGRIFQTIETNEGQYNDQQEIFWATGACLFVRSSVYNELGGLDDRFFAHMEEIDFCWRAKNKGYKIMYNGGSKVYHVGGGTLPKQSWRKTYLNMRNNNIMLFKNLPDDQVWKIFISRLFLDGIAAIKFLVDGGSRNLFAVIKAHWHFFGMIPTLYRERKVTEHLHQTKVYGKNLVVEHFLLGKKKFKELDHTKFS